MFVDKTSSKLNKFSLFRADFLIIIATVILGVGLINFYSTASRPYLERAVIDESIGSIPNYALLSFTRSIIALLFSYIFAIFYGGLAAKNKFWERILIPLLDILQSLPVIAFLPGFVLGMISIFHNNRWGLEIAVLLTIFTGQVWNIAFAYYEAQKNLQSEFNDVADMYKLSKTQRFFYIHMPNAYPQLIYNGMMSMAGGWFFITTCEAFTLGYRDFLVPGIGSYLASTFSHQLYFNFSMGLSILIILILGTNFLLWRPLVQWSSRFQTSVKYQVPPNSLFLDKFSDITKGAFKFWIDKTAYTPSFRLKPKSPKFLKKAWFLNLIGPVFLALIVFYFLPKLSHIGHSLIALANVDWFFVMGAVFFTGLKVLIVLVFSSIWTIPAGIWLGLNPKAERIMQPIIQNLASFPAPIIFPLLVMILHPFLPPFINATVLMAVGCQWYILFNVMGGASRMSADLTLVANVYQFSLWQKFKLLYFPFILPSLVTGWITAAGGAWNASMVAEIVEYPGGVMSTLGVGAEMMEATQSGNYPKLVASIICVVIVLVVINRTVWYTLQEYTEKVKE